MSKIFCTSISGKYSYGGAFIDFVGKTVCIMSWDTCEGVQKIELPYEIKDGMIIIPNEYTGDSYMLEMYDDNTVKFIKIGISMIVTIYQMKFIKKNMIRIISIIV